MATGKFSSFSFISSFKTKLISASNRIDINFTRQRTSNRRGSLH
jgi:hypothetical protein